MCPAPFIKCLRDFLLVPRFETKRTLFSLQTYQAQNWKTPPFRSHSRVNAARGNAGYRLWGHVESVRTIVDIGEVLDVRAQETEMIFVSKLKAG